MSETLRPVKLTDFHGQDTVTRELEIVLKAAKSRKENPPHILLSGPPGLGKTTLSQIIANYSELPLVATSAPVLEKPSDLIGVLVKLTTPSVVFVDEIHRLPKQVEETLYSALEDGKIDIVLPDGNIGSRTISMKLSPFTLVGATTSAGSLGAPFRDRFGYHGRLKLYDSGTLASIVLVNAKKLNFILSKPGAELIGSRCRGTPRIANRILGRVIDYAHSIDSAQEADETVVQEALDAFGVDSKGLDDTDREILEVICKKFDGGPVGLSTLAAGVGESTETIESMHEPYLMRLGFINRTPRGRVTTRAAFEHLGLEEPEPKQLSL